MANQAENPIARTQEELHREAVEQNLKRDFQVGLDRIWEARQYGRQAGLSETEIDDIFQEVSGEGE